MLPFVLIYRAPRDPYVTLVPTPVTQLFCVYATTHTP